jgi:hypothetical protein
MDMAVSSFPGPADSPISEAHVTLTGTRQPMPGRINERVRPDTGPLRITYSLTRVGVSMVGSGVTADNRGRFSWAITAVEWRRVWQAYRERKAALAA